MLLSDVSQLITECSEWKEILRNYKEEFQKCKKALEESFKNSLTKEQLTQVEQFDNRFHIQLINIHDLKQSIKAHEQKVKFEASQGAASNASSVYHEDLLDHFLFLENRLQELRENFEKFVNATSC